MLHRLRLAQKHWPIAPARPATPPLPGPAGWVLRSPRCWCSVLRTRVGVGCWPHFWAPPIPSILRSVGGAKAGRDNLSRLPLLKPARCQLGIATSPSFAFPRAEVPARLARPRSRPASFVPRSAATRHRMPNPRPRLATAEPPLLPPPPSQPRGPGRFED